MWPLTQSRAKYWQTKEGKWKPFMQSDEKLALKNQMTSAFMNQGEYVHFK